MGNGVNYFQPINKVKTENNKYLKILLSQKHFGEGRYLKCGGVDKTTYTKLLFINLELTAPGCLYKQVPFISDLITVQNYLPLPKCFCAILCFPEEISKH